MQITVQLAEQDLYKNLFLKKIAEEAAEKSIYLQDLIRESKIISEEIISALLNKANELTVIFTSIGKTSKQNLNHSKSENQNLK